MFHSQRISIIGTSGCGKTTLARQLCQRLAIPHIELDALHWEANWTEVPTNFIESIRLRPSQPCPSQIPQANIYLVVEFGNIESGISLFAIALPLPQNNHA